jgi:hypothetical protein
VGELQRQSFPLAGIVFLARKLENIIAIGLVQLFKILLLDETCSQIFLVKVYLQQTKSLCSYCVLPIEVPGLVDIVASVVLHTRVTRSMLVSDNKHPVDLVRL